MLFILYEGFRSALIAIATNKLRSFLTSLGIIIGVASIIAVVSLVQGLEKSITDQLEGVGSNSLFIQQKRDNYGRLIGNLSDDDLFKLRQIDGVENIYPQTFVFEYPDLQYGAEKFAADIVGVTADAVKGDESNVPTKGRFFSNADGDSRRKVAVLGHKVAKELKLPDNPIGEFIRYGPHWFKVIGVMVEKGQMMGQDMDNIVYIPYSTAVNIIGYQKQPFVMFIVLINDAENLEFISDRMTRVLRRQHSLATDQDDDFTIQSSDQLLDTIGQITDILTLVFGGIVGISLLVGGIGIMNIMLVSVTERTREVGICKALGATRSDILLQFLIESVVISLIGGFIGLGLGYGLGIGIAAMIPNFPPSEVPVWAVALAIGFSSGTGVIFGILPAAKAARLDPIDALRYE